MSLTTSSKEFKLRRRQSNKSRIYNRNLSDVQVMEYKDCLHAVGYSIYSKELLRNFKTGRLSMVDLTDILAAYVSDVETKMNVNKLCVWWIALYDKLNPHTGYNHYCTDEDNMASLRTWFHQLNMASQQHHFKGGKRCKKESKIILFNSPKLLKMNHKRNWLPCTSEYNSDHKRKRHDGEWIYLLKSNVKSEKIKFKELLPSKNMLIENEEKRTQGFKNRDFFISEII